MSELNNLDGLESAFHEKIEGQSMALPPSVWQNVKIAAIERQLIKYQYANNLLKGLSGLLGAALLATLVLLNYKKEVVVNVPQVVTTFKTDTLYLTKIQKEYVTIYKTAKSIVNSKTNNNEAIASTENGFTPKRKFTNLEKTNQLTENNIARTNNTETTDQENLDINSNIFSKKSNREYTNIEPNSINTNSKSNISQKNTSENGNQSLSYTTFESKIQYENSIQNITDNQSIKLELLKPISIENEKIVFAIPKIKIKSTQIPISKKPIEHPKEPITNRFTLASYFMPEFNSLNINRKERNAFDYANEEVRSSNTIGLRVGIKLNTRLTLITGVEYSKLSFDEFEKIQTFTAENWNGIPTYLYKHALGTIILPNSKLTVMPKVGDKLQVGTNEPISSIFLKTTLGFKYDIYGGNVKFIPNNKCNWNIYSTASATINTPIRQEIRLDVVQNNNITRFEISKIDNQRPFVGFNLGFGLGVNYGRNIGIFVEPSFSQSLSSLVYDKSLESHLSSFGVKIGASWHFMKK